MVDYSAYHWAEKARKHAESMPTVYDSTITVTQGGVTKGSFTLNQSSAGTIALDSGGSGTDLPDQTGHAGEYLTTDGTSASWGSITIPTVNNATLTIQKNGTNVATFTANSSTNATANISVPTQASDIGAQETLVSGTNIKTINNTSLLGSGDITITQPTVNDGTLTIQQNGTTLDTFTANSSTNKTVNIKTPIFNLFDFKWTDYELGDQSWLRADTFSWQDGTVYSDAYNHLLDDIDGKSAQQETVADRLITYYLADDGHKIVDVADVHNVELLFNDTGIAWYYIIDTTNHRFKLPRTQYGFTGYRNYVGGYVEPGLPNITGDIFPVSWGGNTGVTPTTSGAFTVDISSNQAGHTGSNYIQRSGGLYFDASDSDEIYGNSYTVQPPATQMYLYFYVGQFSQTATEQTAGLNASLFNGKVDLDALNLSDAGKSLVAGLSAPSDTYEDLTLLASGESYTAPANGYFEFAKASNSANQYYSIYNNANGMQVAHNVPSSGQTPYIFFYCKKGDVIGISYNLGGTTARFRFVYAVGSESEAS